MPFTLTPVAYGGLHHSSTWVIADEGVIVPKPADLELGQLRHLTAIFADIDKKGSATGADAVKGASTLRLSAPLPFELREPAC